MTSAMASEMTWISFSRSTHAMLQQMVLELLVACTRISHPCQKHTQERRRNREATVYLPALGGDGPRLDRMIRIYKCSQASSAEESLKCCAALLAVSTET